MDLICEVFDDTPSRLLAFAELSIGQAVFQRVKFDEVMLEHFDRVAKDRAPVHGDARFAWEAGFEAPIVQGLGLATRFSRLLGMYLPGERAILETIDLKFRRPVYAGVELEYRAVITRLFKPLRIAQLALSISVDQTDHVNGTCRCVVR
jgi:3-hydroxybutyryl-CoA dehydratase